MRSQGNRKWTGTRTGGRFISWCVERGDFQPSVQDELKDYFENGAGKQIRSFISRRLTGEKGTAIGVLNLHADRPNILGPAVERREVFQAMLTPFFVELSQAIELLIALQRGHN
jgi:hypothetical protein